MEAIAKVPEKHTRTYLFNDYCHGTQLFNSGSTFPTLFGQRIDNGVIENLSDFWKEGVCAKKDAVYWGKVIGLWGGAIAMPIVSGANSSSLCNWSDATSKQNHLTLACGQIELQTTAQGQSLWETTQDLINEKAIAVFLGDRAYKRFCEIKDITEGWDFGLGRGFDRRVLSPLAKIAASGYSIPHKIRIYPNEEGGIDINWKDSKDRLFILECFHDKFGYYNEDEDEHGALDLSKIDELAAKLSLHKPRYER